MLLIVLILTGLLHGCISESSSYQNRGISQNPAFLHEFLQWEALESASVGLMAVDVETGAIILEHNAAKSLVPASVQKLLIAGAMLETFGAAHTFETQLAFTGKVDATGTLRGDIIISGGGDPAFFSPAFDDHYRNVFSDFAQAVKKLNITKVAGNIIGDGSFFGRVPIPGTWIWEDIGNYFGAMPTGLDFAENSYTITFRSGKPGSPVSIVKTEPELPVTFDNYVVAADNNRDNAWIYGTYLSERREIRGTIPANRQAFSIRGANPNPALTAANNLEAALEKSGIEVEGTAVANYAPLPEVGSTTIFTFQSPPLSQMVERLNRHSVNLFAESFLLHLAKYYQKSPTISEGSKVLMEFWKERGMDTRGMFLQDGSGLSRANALSAKHLAFLLRYLHDQKQLSAAFKQSLPVAGVSGSLKNFGTDNSLKENFIAKSGYMSRVMSFAGYLNTQNGNQLALVVMVNNYNCSNAEIREQTETLLSEISIRF